MGLKREPPRCGPFASSGMPRSNTTPRRTACAAARRHSAVMKLTVPSSSASPQRPQLLTRAPTARKSVTVPPQSPARPSPGDLLAFLAEEVDVQALQLAAADLPVAARVAFVLLVVVAVTLEVLVPGVV